MGKNSVLFAHIPEPVNQLVEGVGKNCVLIAHVPEPNEFFCEE